jgi:excisionase family DNA binding protein
VKTDERRVTSLGADRLLTYSEAAQVLNTSERFPRRLVEERCIHFVRVDRFIRIPESSLREFTRAGLVEPVSVRRQGRAA